MGGLARNYSRGDVSIAEACVALLAAFTKTGDPSPKPEEHQETNLSWPRYELNTQQYLSIGNLTYSNKDRSEDLITLDSYLTQLGQGLVRLLQKQ